MPNSHNTVSRRIAPFAPLAIALLMNRAVLSPPGGQTGETESPTEVTAAVCDDVLDFQDCHTRFPTGCSSAGRYDAYLNLLKNQLIPPPAGITGIEFLTREKFQYLDSNTPKGLGRSNHADFKDQLAQLGEGQVFGIVGYLYYAIKTGAESSNCQLTSNDEEGTNVDYHIGIGFDPPDPALAQLLRAQKKLSRDQHRSLQQSSVIVEMTPHYRFLYGGPGWTIDSLQNVLGRPVRVVGQLLNDNEHNLAAQNCALATTPQEKLSCWRASTWELHPVTRFEVCERASCDQNSTDWMELAAAQP
jgi:hypothetical protein